MGSLTNPFRVPVLRREGHFDVQSRTPSDIPIDQYGPSIFQRFARYAVSLSAQFAATDFRKSTQKP